MCDVFSFLSGKRVVSDNSRTKRIKKRKRKKDLKNRGGGGGGGDNNFETLACVSSHSINFLHNGSENLRYCLQSISLPTVRKALPA